MGSNQEIARIQEWVANWYGTSVENSPFSREDIRNICRGPMREVLVDFLVSRFRTDAQIKVIRSNLFLTDLVDSRSIDDQGSGDSASQDEEQLKQLKRKLEEVQDQKVDIVKQIIKAVEKMHESNIQLQKEFLENLSHFEKLESRMQLINHRVLSTARLLDDVSNIKPPSTVVLDSGSSSSNNGTSKTETNSLHLSQLKSLYSKASDLFNVYFHQKPFTNGYSGSSPEMQSLSSLVSTQTVELAQSGVKPNFIEKWARKEQEVSTHQINKVELKFSNVMSPVEELANEAEALHIKLMKAHVNLYFKNREIRNSLREVKAQKSRRIQNVVLSDATIVPADFLSFIQKEEQQRKLMKCRELAKDFKSFENCGSINKEVDLLSMLCGKINSGDESGIIQIPGSSNDETARSADNGFNYIMQENLEELTCALLKGFPDGRHKLESTVSQCKTLMEKFANLFCSENSVNNGGKIDSVHTERGDSMYEALDLHFKPPQLFLKQDLSSTNSSVPTTNEQDQMDSLREVFMLQNELKESRLQFEAMCHVK